MTLTLNSPAFGQRENIPAMYTCQGSDISPPLTWTESPEGTQSYALIMDDPDAPGGVFTHWLIYDIPASVNQLPEGMPIEPQVSNGIQGQNDFGRTGYGGPCPPPGGPHRYRFSLYALDQKLNLEQGASKAQLLASMEEHILDRYELTGLFQR